MTPDELRKLYALRSQLKRTGLFVFEKNGTYFCYREVTGARNQKVTSSKNIDAFVRVVTKSLPRSGS